MRLMHRAALATPGLYNSYRLRREVVLQRGLVQAHTLVKSKTYGERLRLTICLR